MRAITLTFGLGLAFSCTLVAACGGSSTTTGTSTTGSGGSTTTSGSTTSGTGGAGGEACDKLIPAGFSYAVQGSMGDALGDDVAMVLNGKGEAVIVYRNIVGESTQWELTRWDSCAGAFTKPVIVATVATTFGHAAPEKNAAIAYDAVKDRLVVAYEVIDGIGSGNEAAALDLVTSDDGGASWSAPKHVAGGNQPAVAADSGKIWFAYTTADQIVHLEVGDGASFEAMDIPDDGDPAEGRYYAPVTSPLSLLLDDQKKPGLVFTSAGDLTGTYQVRVHYWHEGMAHAVSVMDSNNIQDDYPTATLAFDGHKPRVVSHLPEGGSAASEIWFSASDDGTSWSKAVGLPKDATEITSWYQAITVGADGAITVAAHTADPVSSSGLGAPKLWRSSDLKSFAVSAADSKNEHTSFTGAHVQAALVQGKLQLAFRGPLGTGDADGIIVWRAP
jgi:hypothetical protein